MTTEPFQKVSSSWVFRNSFVVVGIGFLVLSSWVVVKRSVVVGVVEMFCRRGCYGFTRLSSRPVAGEVLEKAWPHFPSQKKDSSGRRFFKIRSADFEKYLSRPDESFFDWENAARHFRGARAEGCLRQGVEFVPVLNGFVEVDCKGGEGGRGHYEFVAENRRRI